MSVREDALQQLHVFHSHAQNLLGVLTGIDEVLSSTNTSSENLKKCQKDAKQLADIMSECSRSSAGLDAMLQQAQLTTFDGAVSHNRTTVQGVLNRLQSKYDLTQSQIAIKLDHIDEVDSLWQSFFKR